MAHVALQGITKKFRRHKALDALSLEVGDGEFFVLLGPTGAGKTTTLRLIAGLDGLDAGSISIGGKDVAGWSAAERDVALVFQYYSLYPHYTVRQNLEFPLRSKHRHFSPEEIQGRVAKAAKTLRIEHLLERKTDRLSGGEMQRVSIGRAIVREPRVFLMDEPLSNLDAKLREALRLELKHLQKTQGSTTLFVTHDQIEALTMADRIAVLNEGRIVQQGAPVDIYDRPATTFVAQLVGTPRINLLEAGRDGGAVSVKGGGLSLPAPRLPLPESFLLGIRPEDIRPEPKGAFLGKVFLTEPLGVETILHIRCGELTLLSLVPGMAAQRVGEELRFGIAQEKLHYFGLDKKRITAE